MDYVINLLKSQANNNPKADVYLRSFLETLMEDINKSLGNINLFRVGYYDDANTVRIYDDQIINPPTFQSLIQVNNNSELYPYGIPIMGKNSIVRSLTLKTETSTALSNEIAISAQVGNFGAMNSDASSLGNLNKNERFTITDRIMKVKQTAINPALTKKEKESIEADKSAAKNFNKHIKNLYNAQVYVKGDIDIAKNYYCSAANKLKADSVSTISRKVLPISINISTDGISGMSLLEGFTIPTDILPQQYQDSLGRSKVGFAVAGLNHSIDGNQWITSIRGQMINLPVSGSVNSSEFGQSSISSNVSQQVPSNIVSGGGNPKPLGKDQKSAYDKAEQLEPGFKAKVAQVAQNIGATELALAKVMYFESAGTYSPAITNSIGCVGLTQFCPDTSRGAYKTIGGTRYELANLKNMTRIQQLDVVEKYFKALRFSSNKPVGIGELYLVNLYPVALNKSNDFILGSENADPNRKFKVASQNPGFPTSIKIDGRPVLTRGDVVRFVNSL
jgi:hypothetical protein